MRWRNLRRRLWLLNINTANCKSKNIADYPQSLIQNFFIRSIFFSQKYVKEKEKNLQLISCVRTCINNSVSRSFFFVHAPYYYGNINQNVFFGSLNEFRLDFELLKSRKSKVEITVCKIANIKMKNETQSAEPLFKVTHITIKWLSLKGMVY